MEKKKIYLVKYTDTEDNTSGVICGSSTEELSEGAQIAVGKWLDLPFTISHSEKEDVIHDLIEFQQATINEYELFIEETYIY